MNFLHRSDRFVYLKAQLPAGLFDGLVQRFGGKETHALRELRYRWDDAVARLTVEVFAEPPTSGPDQPSQRA
jgi:hypothetical protein